MDIFERLKRGETIAGDDPQAYRMREESYATKELLVRMNNSADPAEIRQLLGEITGRTIDETTSAFTPVYINYGKDMRIGKNVFINFGCTFLALGGIDIGDNVLLGPNVSLLTEGHPELPGERHNLKVARITVGNNVWIGAGATVLQSVTIGENSIIAAGAVVTGDVPANTIFAGIPAKEVRKIKNKD